MKQNKSRKSVLAALLVVSILSIVVNFVLYSQLRKYYTLLYAIELDPLGLSYFQDTSPQKPARDLQTVIFFGDSRSAQWPSPTINGFWFVNRGLGNQTTAQIVNRFEEHITPLQPDIIVLQAGINDLKTIPLFPERRQEIISNCKENIRQVITLSLRSNSVVVISTIFPTGKVPLQRRLVWSDDIDTSIVDVNDFIRTLAADNVIILDAEKLLSDPNGKMKREYGYDELHLNEAGYEVLNLNLVNLLEKIKEDSQ